ncbi:hypothetical protein SDC9_197117 [bioreactor metagenome]|uniref:Uncharacterized protein n=1 Tax=bioreactor metagenome TaxID=1076179 RepID=A0A645IEX1_9ZZZZ
MNCDHFGFGSNIDAVAVPQGFLGGDNQVAAFLDHFTDMVRQAAVGETDIGAALKHDDGRGFIQSAQTSGRSCSAGDAADN